MTVDAVAIPIGLAGLAGWGCLQLWVSWHVSSEPGAVMPRGWALAMPVALVGGVIALWAGGLWAVLGSISLWAVAITGAPVAARLVAEHRAMADAYDEHHECQDEQVRALSMHMVRSQAAIAELAEQDPRVLRILEDSDSGVPPRVSAAL